MKNEKKEKIKKNKNGKINKKNIYKNNGERGSITILVLTSLLFFIMFFMTMYAKNTNKISSQEREIKEIEKAYNEDIEMEYSKKIEEIKNQSISNDVSYVGKYADIDNDGIIDGIIFADLAIGNTVSGNFGDSNGAYTIPKETGLKEYYVKKTEKYERWDINNAKEVIAPKIGTSGKDRFYVMALENVDVTGHTWWASALGKMEDASTKTKTGFGEGKVNTKNILELALETPEIQQNKYGKLDAFDLWALDCVKNKIGKTLQEAKSSKWFVPSRAEWAAFANELHIDRNSYANHNLKVWYWSSSQNDASAVWGVHFLNGYVGYIAVNYSLPVRLAATF